MYDILLSRGIKSKQTTEEVNYSSFSKFGDFHKTLYVYAWVDTYVLMKFFKFLS